jgi:multiple antibiotic resistance protein
MQDWRHYAESATALFVIADPIGAVPLFITLTTNQGEHEKRQTAKVAATTVAIVLVVSIFAGQPLLTFFGISVPEEASVKDEIAVVPLGIPLVAGPGAISTMIIYAHQVTGWFDTVFLIFAGDAGCSFRLDRT